MGSRGVKPFAAPPNVYQSPYSAGVSIIVRGTLDTAPYLQVVRTRELLHFVDIVHKFSTYEYFRPHIIL